MANKGTIAASAASAPEPARRERRRSDDDDEDDDDESFKRRRGRDRDDEEEEERESRKRKSDMLGLSTSSSTSVAGGSSDAKDERAAKRMRQDGCVATSLVFFLTPRVLSCSAPQNWAPGPGAFRRPPPPVAAGAPGAAAAAGGAPVPPPNFRGRRERCRDFFESASVCCMFSPKPDASLVHARSGSVFPRRFVPVRAQRALPRRADWSRRRRPHQPRHGLLSPV